MKKHFVLFATGFLVLLGFIPSCSTESGSTKNTPREFVATDADFSNFTSWQKVGQPLKGPDPAGMLGDAHGAKDAEIMRTVYIKPSGAERASNGEFPRGTIFVKELRKPDGTVPMVTVMAKRGGDFNKEHKGWEWFMTDRNGKIMNRGAGLMDNMCNMCHSGKASKDYVFTK